MFRASDIFGRRPGAASTAKTPLAAAKAAPVQKRGPESSGPSTRMWDPATGEYHDEELPDEVQELMGIRQKKAKVEVKEEQSGGQAWGSSSRPGGILGPGRVGLSPQAPKSADDIGRVDANSPSVEYRGFSKVDLNDRYYERASVSIHARPTYWSQDGQFFLYWQGEVQRWSICDSASLPAVRAGQLPGWAYKGDHRHLCQANGWMEAWDGTWREPELEVIFRSSSTHRPQWEDVLVQKSISTVQFSGFTMKELNCRFHLRAGETIQGEPSYWDSSGVYFIYWQAKMRRWAICDLKCLEAVKEGQCPGWAYRENAGHFANAGGWKETRGGQWVDAVLETAVIGASTKGLKIEFNGFAKQELNVQYTEKADEDIQGRASFWDATDNYFIYWQSSMKRWAICDQVSLHSAKSGLSPGWAYRTDSQHFAKSSGWMEAWGRDWKSAVVSCTVLEGTVKDDSAFIKAEPSDEPGTLLSTEQYKTLVRKIYEQKNPSKLIDLEKLFVKYQDQMHELFAQVCAKYQADAEELAAQLPTELSGAFAAAVAASEKAPLAPKQESKQEPVAKFESREMPDLSAAEFAELIQYAYQRFNPAKLADFGRLLRKYRSREGELYLLVCDKYVINPASFAAEHKDKLSAGSGGDGYGLAAAVGEEMN